MKSIEKMLPLKSHTNGLNWFVTGKDDNGAKVYVADIHHCRDADGNERDEQIARLFATAPELLDALRQWQHAETTGDAEELSNARQSRDRAIAKATNAE